MRPKEAQVSEAEFRDLTTRFWVNAFTITSAETFKQGLLDVPEEHRTEWLLDFIDSDMPNVTTGIFLKICILDSK